MPEERWALGSYRAGRTLGLIEAFAQDCAKRSTSGTWDPFNGVVFCAGEESAADLVQQVNDALEKGYLQFPMDWSWDAEEGCWLFADGSTLHVQTATAADVEPDPAFTVWEDKAQHVG